MRRHDLAYVQPQSTPRLPCTSANSALAADVSSWVAAGRPLVAARQTASNGDIELGLTLPAAAGRQRVRCLLRAEDLLKICDPLSITDCRQSLPEAIAPPLLALEARLLRERVRIGVFGSLSWETLSGEVYRHAESDVDLICDVTTRQQYESSLDALNETASDLPCRLDGEIRFPDGSAVAWRELLASRSNPRTQVLAKRNTTVLLCTLETLIGQLEEHSHAL